MPFLVAMEARAVRAGDTAAVGDAPCDVEAAHAAGVVAIAATWGASDVPALLAAKPDHVIARASELLPLLA